MSADTPRDRPPDRPEHDRRPETDSDDWDAELDAFLADKHAELAAGAAADTGSGPADTPPSDQPRERENLDRDEPAAEQWPMGDADRLLDFERSGASPEPSTAADDDRSGEDEGEPREAPGSPTPTDRGVPALPGERRVDTGADDPYGIWEFGPEISRQKQARHVKDTKEWEGDQGGYFTSFEDARRVMESVHNGSAQVLGRLRNGALLVRCDEVTGYNNSPYNDFVDQPTHVFFIKRTVPPNRPTSVVPTSPEKRPTER